MGSVKDLRILKQPNAQKLGVGRFTFSDRYSVFDWGKMPNDIKNKGEALCLIGAFFFEKLEEIGIKTHYRGLVEDDKVKKLSELKKPTNVMEIDLLQVLKPNVINNTYDYSMYQLNPPNILIPLEIIYRNSLPAGSSVFKRIKEGTLNPKDIGLDEDPQPGQKLRKPIFDLSTKLESTDRYITYAEAKKIAGLTDYEFDKIMKINQKVNALITNEVSRLGLVNEDGKIELGFDINWDIIIVDVLGTPDECRFTLDGIPVSKELARIYYRDTKWAKEIDDAKKKEKFDWKKLVKTQPEKLPKRFETLISQLYQSFCNEITKYDWFESLPLRDILSELKEIM